MSKQILFPTDFSIASQTALPYATSLARDRQASLLIVHVVEGDKYPAGRWFQKGPKVSTEETAQLEEILPADSSVEFEHRMLFGSDSKNPPNPAGEILMLAKQENVDAIVMGTHGRSGIDHLLMGSVAESVVHHATCPVVTVKQPHNKQ
ncbi:MAG: universal stress protein [Planctomycetales bacterium]